MYRFLFLIVNLLVFFVPGNGQGVCEGSLGDNIFPDGDFGSGTSNVLLTNPNIAPGYTYTLNAPPDDGFYTLSNNTGNWSNIFPTWLTITDNSADPNGYMMIVNASFDPGIFYEKTITGLCENTLYEFSADIINMITPGTPDHIDPNVDFLLDGATLYSTGVIPKTGEWAKFGFTFTTNSTQSEIVLTLRNNAPGGIGNDLALDNISFRPCGPRSFIDISSTETIFLCPDDDPLTITADIRGASGQEFSIFWEESNDGNNWEELGIMNVDNIIHDRFIPRSYYYRYISAANDANLLNTKCRIISDVITIEVLPITFNLRDTICEGSEYVFGSNILVNSGTYEETFNSSFDCDSIVTLELAVLPEIPIVADEVLIDPSCSEYEDGSISLENISGGYMNYRIEMDGLIVENPLVDIGAGIYNLSIVDRYGCREIFSLELIDPELFSIQLMEDLDVTFGEEFIFQVETNYPISEYLWGPDDIFSCNNCDEPIALPKDDGFITLIATSEFGCVASDSLFVSVSREAAVFIPNIFSPNDDGINDVFSITGFRNSVDIIPSISVFDRWGNLVYQQQNIDTGNLALFWDGKINGKEVELGVYTYYFEIRYIDGIEESFTGSITLIR